VPFFVGEIRIQAWQFDVDVMANAKFHGSLYHHRLVDFAVWIKEFNLVPAGISRH
jgi:hypothetical protein